MVLLVAITFTILDRSTDSGPVDAATDYVKDGLSSVGDLFSLSPSPSQLRTENERLKTQLDEAQGRLAQTDAIRRERDTLAELMNLQTYDAVPKVVARVTEIGGSNFDASIELGKGTDDGIASGMPVVTGKGLVGRVIETTKSRSTVLLIDDTTSNVGVRFSNAGDVGVSVGQGINNDTRVDLIDLDSKVAPGEVAVTSGLQNSLFPPGIPVGTVVSTTAGPQDLRRVVNLKPLINVQQLDNVAVLQWKQP